MAPDAQKLAVDMLDVTKGKTCSTVTFYNFGSVGQNEIVNNVGTYSYKNTMIFWDYQKIFCLFATYFLIRSV